MDEKITVFLGREELLILNEIQNSRLLEINTITEALQWSLKVAKLVLANLEEALPAQVARPIGRREVEVVIPEKGIEPMPAPSLAEPARGSGQPPSFEIPDIKPAVATTTKARLFLEELEAEPKSAGAGQENSIADMR